MKILIDVHAASVTYVDRLLVSRAAGHLRPHVGLVVPLEGIRDALKAFGDRSATGRVVVKVH